MSIATWVGKTPAEPPPGQVGVTLRPPWAAARLYPLVSPRGAVGGWRGHLHRGAGVGRGAPFGCLSVWSELPDEGQAPIFPLPSPRPEGTNEDGLHPKPAPVKGLTPGLREPVGPVVGISTAVPLGLLLVTIIAIVAVAVAVVAAAAAAAGPRCPNPDESSCPFGEAFNFASRVATKSPARGGLPLSLAPETVSAPGLRPRHTTTA